MHVYEVSPDEHSSPLYFGDQKALRADLRQYDKGIRHRVRITLVDVPSDKATLVELLNCRRASVDRKVLKRWRIGGPRGGKLVEITDEED